MFVVETGSYEMCLLEKGVGRKIGAAVKRGNISGAALAAMYCLGVMAETIQEFFSSSSGSCGAGKVVRGREKLVRLRMVGRMGDVERDLGSEGIAFGGAFALGGLSALKGVLAWLVSTLYHATRRRRRSFSAFC